VAEDVGNPSTLTKTDPGVLTSCHGAARRSVPLMPRRGKHAGIWLQARHSSACSHGMPKDPREAKAGGSILVSGSGSILVSAKGMPYPRSQS